MRAFVLLLAFVLAPAASACSAADITCPTTLDGLVSAFTAPKVPLNTQSGCAGYTRAPFQVQSVPGANPPACSVQPNDPCAACVGGECCAQIDSACTADGGAVPLSVCAAEPSVRNCILGALAGACAMKCMSSDAGTGGGSHD